MNGFKAIMLVLVGVLMSGCSINMAKLHTGLSREDFDGRVRESFCIGMPLDEAKGVVKELGLRMKCWGRHKDYVCVSELYPRGVYRKSVAGFGGSDFIHTLTLHFGDDAMLDSITRHGRRSPGSNIICMMAPPRVILLDDCNQNKEVGP